MKNFEVLGPTCISFSGGRTSGYMLWLTLQAHGEKLPDDTHVVFANTGKEEEATLRFVRDCAERWGVPIVWVEYRPDGDGWTTVDFHTASRNGEPFDALIRKRNYLPNPVARFCTVELKILPWISCGALDTTNTKTLWASGLTSRAELQRCATTRAAEQKALSAACRWPMLAFRSGT